MKRRRRRVHIIVIPKIQLRVFSLILATTIIPIGLLYFVHKFFVHFYVQEFMLGNPEFVQLVEIIDGIHLQTFLAIIAIMLALGYLQTLFLHKIIGPLYRIETDLKEMLKNNDFSRKIRIRPDDLIHSFNDTLNLLLERLNKASIPPDKEDVLKEKNIHDEQLIYK
ncbi:MAG: hypothetical protein ACMUJM_13605 [bacterium]